MKVYSFIPKMTKTQKLKFKEYLKEGFSLLEIRILIIYHRQYSLCFYLKKLFKEKRVYPCSYLNRDTEYDYHKRIIEILIQYNIKYELGNNAPRGGFLGNYIKLI